MVKEKLYVKTLNYVNGISWSYSNIFQDAMEEDEEFMVSSNECIDNNAFEELNISDWICIISLNEIVELLNHFYDICRKSGYQFSSTVTSKVRIIEWDNCKKKLEKEEIIRLSVNSNTKDYCIIDIPIGDSKDKIFKSVKEAFFKIFKDDNSYSKLDFKDNMVDIILSPTAAGYFIHEIIGHPLELDFVENNQSFYTINDLGKQIMPEYITVKEEPLDLKSIGIDFGKYDDSGNELREKEIIKNGILMNFIDYQRCDQINNTCFNRMYNLSLKPNKDDIELDNIVGKESKALIVDNIISGFFNLMIQKYTLYCGRCKVVDNGNILGYVDGIVIEDDISSIKDKLVDVGSDFNVSLGKCNKLGQVITVGMGAPTIKLKNIKIKMGE